MAFFKEIVPCEGIRMGFWKLDESSKELESMVKMDDYDREQYNVLKIENRKREFMAIRVLLKAMTGEKYHIRYQSSGKPFILEDNLYIGITHTKGWAGLIIGNQEVAIDMEPAQTRILRIIQRVCRPDELIPQEAKESVLHATLCWCAKETLFKLEGNEGVDFVENMHLNPFDVNKKGEIEAEVIWAGKHEKRVLSYFYIEGIPVVFGQK